MNKPFLKKSIAAALLAGAFAAAGASFALPGVSQAAAPPRPGHFYSERHDPGRTSRFDAAAAAQRLAEMYGVDENAVKSYLDKGRSFHDVGRAAFLAYASGQSFEKILNAKTVDLTWIGVQNKFNISSEQTTAARQKLCANDLSARLELDKGAVLQLLQQGRHPREIAMAGALARQSGKSLGDVAALKTLDVTWHGVAAQLGVGQAGYDQAVQQVNAAFPRRHKGGPGPGCDFYRAPLNR